MGASRKDKGNSLTFGSDGPRSTEKLRELVLYIADKCEDDPTFGAVKLNKILFYADFISFAEYGEPITGVKYRKFEQGPVPTILRRVRMEMEDGGDLVIRKKSYHGRMQHRPIPLRPPDFNQLGARDIALVDDMIQAFWNRTAQEVSELSHDRAWKNALEGEVIPYEAAFVSDEPLTDHDIAIAEEMIAEYERFEQSAGRL